MPAMNRRTAISFAIPSAWALMNLLATPAGAQTAPRLPVATAINRAGRMRALSQRASKAYVQGALGVLSDRARDIGQTTQSLVTASLNELNRGAPSADIVPLLKTLEQRSQALLTLTSQEPRVESVGEVARLADAMLASAEALTQGYEKTATQGAARVVNVAGRQRMLSQRAARAYFLLGAGQSGKDVQSQLDETRKAFVDSLAVLQGSPVSTPHIRNELELAKAQWVFFDTALQKAPTPGTMQVVATTSERVYEVMDNLTALYDQTVRELFS